MRILELTHIICKLNLLVLKEFNKNIFLCTNCFSENSNEI